MSIIEGGGKSETPPSPSTGWLIAAAIAAAQCWFAWGIGGWADGFILRGAVAHGGLFYWSQARDVTNAAYVCAAVPAVLIPRAFESLRGRSPSWTGDPIWVRRRWTVVAIVIVTGLIGDGGMAWHAASGGYATPTGAAWVNARGDVARHGWEEARGVQVACSNWSAGRALTYQVIFADGRRTRSEIWNRNQAGMPQWVANMAEVDQRISHAPAAVAADFRQIGDVEPCRQDIAPHLDSQGQALLQRLLLPRSGGPAP